MLYFSIQNARGGPEKQPRLRGGLRMTVSCSDPARIQLGMVSDRSRIVIDVSSVFEKFLQNFGE